MQDRVRRKRWSATAMREAATVAREKGVSVRLEEDGSIIIQPFIAPLETDEAEYSGLEKW